MSNHPEDDNKIYGTYKLPTVEVMGRKKRGVPVSQLSHEDLKRFGLYLYHNPGKYRQLMRQAKSAKEQEFYFNLRFNASRKIAGDRFVNAAFALSSGVSLVGSAGRILTASSVFARQGATVMGHASRASIQVSQTVSQVSRATNMASWRAYYAMTNGIRSMASNIQSVASATNHLIRPLITPQNLTAKTMIMGGGIDVTVQMGVRVYQQRGFGRDWNESIERSVRDINFASTLTSTLGLPLRSSIILASGINCSINKFGTIFDGTVPMEEFALGLSFGSLSGKLGNSLKHKPLPAKAAAISAGITAGMEHYSFVKPAMLAVFYCLRGLDETIPYAQELLINTAAEFIQSEVQDRYLKNE